MEETSRQDASTANAYVCDGCGAPLEYKPGTQQMVCKYCNSSKNIAQNSFGIAEYDFNSYIQDYKKEYFGLTKVVVCSNCKATPTMSESMKSMKCPYCNSPLIETNATQERYIQPQYVHPFLLSKTDVPFLLERWSKKLWFAPNKIKKAILSPLNLNGIYLPYWTYDAQTRTTYTGARGDTYTVTVGSGDNKRTETRVRWTNTSGIVSNFYDDILVAASRSIDYKLLSKVGNWNTKSIVSIDNSYLAGFITEKYQIDIKEGFYSAKQSIESSERYYVNRDIGGDRQRIYSMDVGLYNVKFKHILLPIYISAFRYRNKLYTFYVNGATGAIAGKRPYSIMKIALTCISIILAILVVAFVAQQ